MNAPQIERVEAVFCSALNIKSPDRQKRFLDRVCKSDAALRAAVDRMLALQSGAETFFREIDVANLLMNEGGDIEPGASFPKIG